MKRFMIAMGTALLLACGGEEATEEEPITANTEPSAEEIPVPEDFTEEAEQEITEENYQEELVEIETDLGAEIE